MRKLTALTIIAATVFGAFTEVYAHPGSARAHATVDALTHHLLSSDLPAVAAALGTAALALAGLYFAGRRRGARRTIAFRRDSATAVAIKGFDPSIGDR